MSLGTVGWFPWRSHSFIAGQCQPLDQHFIFNISETRDVYQTQKQYGEKSSR